MNGTIPTDDNIYNSNPVYAFNGRIGRAQFLAYGLILNIILSVGITLSYEHIHDAVLVAIFGFTNFVLLRRRLHDLDHSSFLVLIFLISYVRWILLLYVLFSPGNEGLNYFGYPAKPPKIWHKVVAVLYVPLLVILVLTLFTR